ncbi:MAG: peptidoglycan-binding protein [Candidatus Nomurabacteria bacterium]
MKKLLLGLFIFVLFAIYGQAYASDLNLTSTDNTKSFGVVKDQIISITLCNPGDSGSKFDTPQYDSSILSLTSHINVPLNTPNPPGLTGGCYGNDVFKFQALNSGSSKIIITVSQPWTGGSTATIFSSDITVTTISTPSIVVTSPNNGGESVEVGGKIEIRWMSPDIISALNDVYVSDGIHKGHTESIRMENYLGSLIYTLDSNLIPGSNYKAYVSTAYGSAISASDSSDLPFTIKPSSVSDGCILGQIYSSTTGQKCTILVPVCPAMTLLNCANGTHQVYSGKDSNGCDSYVCKKVSENNGCSNGQIYSSTTGALCPKIVEENAGCTGVRYSLTTGKACPLNTVTEEGCKVGQIYSSTTGQKCTQVVIQTVDQGCNGNKYSTTTGNMCPISTIKIDEGCLSGQNFSSTTGQKCTPSITPIGTIKRTLKWGLSGDDVRALQKNLGFSNTDGIYGTWTMTKVKEWQTKNGLNADGVFGPESRSKMGL